MLPTIASLRHALHRYPERSGQEQATAQRIRTFVEAHHPTEIIEQLGGHGLAVVYRFADEGPTVVIRCELDALPLEETGDCDYRSTRAGVAHLCGHDGHMAIVAGLSPWLAEQAFGRGTVILLFQPAEETGQGARAVRDDPRFAELRPDYLFALHNIPGEPMGTVVLVDGGFSATVHSVVVYLIGKVSHASEPEKGRNPARAIAEIIQALDELTVSDLTRPDFALLTPVHLTMGQPDYGISAGAGELHFTLRTRTEGAMQQLKTCVNEQLTRISRKYALTWHSRWFDYFPAVANDAFCNERIRTAAHALQLKVKQPTVPYKFGEDFGWFSQHYPVAMFGLGAGEHTPALHHTDYDFPDALLPVGTKLFQTIIKDILTTERPTLPL